jgi:hypothetical protein
MQQIFALLLTLFLSLPAFAANYDAKKVASGDLTELHRAFIERAKADGAMGEEIDIMIGKSIDRRPQNFLKALQDDQAKTHGIVRLDSLVGNLGPEFVDKLKKQQYYLQKRIITLKKVTDPSLKIVRDLCIVELQRQWNQIHAAQSMSNSD